jgi:hypothetical protein
MPATKPLHTTVVQGEVVNGDATGVYRLWDEASAKNCKRCRECRAVDAPRGLKLCVFVVERSVSLASAATLRPSRFGF